MLSKEKITPNWVSFLNKFLSYGCLSLIVVSVIFFIAQDNEKELIKHNNSQMTDLNANLPEHNLDN
jgi:hypothetical protein